MTYKVVMPFQDLGFGYSSKDFESLDVDFIYEPCDTDDEIIRLAEDADAIIARSSFQAMPSEVISRLTQCRIIAGIGIGYDKLDVEAATKAGICVTNCGDYCVEEVSDHTMALLLCWARRIFPLDRLVRAGKWDVEKTELKARVWPELTRLNRMVLGIAGFGRIGRALAVKAKAFGLKRIVYDPYVSPDSIDRTGVESVEFDELVSRSDFISIHTPLTNETKHLFGKEAFDRMKPSAVVINSGRGEVIDQQALYEALVEGKIAAAALDVTDPEPPDPKDPLLLLDNVTLTAHSAFMSAESMAQLRATPVMEILRVLNGKWPRNFINPQVKTAYLNRWPDMID